MTHTLITEVLVVFVCLFAGGLLKGATGAGAPILAVPALASFFDVRVAVVTMLVPNLLTNTWQAWHFHKNLPDRAITWPFWIGGAAGVFGGSMLLVFLSPRWLSLGVAIAVLAYVAARMAKPDWRLSPEGGKKLSLPAGIGAGILQGASGLSAPISITYLNAMRLERSTFIATISTLFATFTLIQIPTLSLSGVVSWRQILISAGALVPVTLAMPVGAWLAQRMSPKVFDRTILAVLGVLALKLLLDALEISPI